MGALIIYRYFMGTKEVIHFYTSRLVTLIMWIIFVSCFIFLAIKKTHGTMLWASVTGLVLLAGLLVARKRSPERKEIGTGDNEMEMILYLAESAAPDVHLYFRRSGEPGQAVTPDNTAFITFYSPRAGIPPKMAPNHFRLPLLKLSLYHRLVARLRVMAYEFGDRQVVVHLGWPLSSWLDRLAIGPRFNMMRLPCLFYFRFVMSYNLHPTTAAAPPLTPRRNDLRAGLLDILLGPWWPGPGGRITPGQLPGDAFTPAAAAAPDPDLAIGGAYPDGHRGGGLTARLGRLTCRCCASATCGAPGSACTAAFVSAISASTILMNAY
jgi:hypothetical protein